MATLTSLSLTWSISGKITSVQAARNLRHSLKYKNCKRLGPKHSALVSPSGHICLFMLHVWNYYRVLEIIPHLSNFQYMNPLTPNDPCSGRTAPLTSKRCILYIYSINTGTEYFKHGIYSSFFFSSEYSLFHNSNVFGSCFIHILYTECAKI